MTPRVLDFETSSYVDLVECGVDRYLEEAVVTAIGWTYGDGFRYWLPRFEPEVPADLLKRDVLNMAHNSRFDRLVWERVLRRDFPALPAFAVEQWLDTAVIARYHGIYNTLDHLLAATGLPLKKSSKTIKAFFHLNPRALPPREDPIWDELVAYLKWDVLGLEEALDRLDPLPLQIWQEFWAAERINDRGLPVDLDAAETARQLLERSTPQFVAAVCNLTGLRPSQYVAMAKWAYQNLPPNVAPLILNPKTGKPSLDSRTGLKVLQEHPDVPAYMREAAGYLGECRKASAYKYTAVAARAVNGRIHGSYVFGGALNTGRFTSHGLQTHNMPKNALPAEEFKHIFDNKEVPPWREIPGKLKNSLRALVHAMAHTILWCDWSQVEARALPWLTKDPEAEPRLDVFRRNEDLYMHTVRELWDSDDRAYRQAAKAAELALGFLGKIEAMKTFCRNLGVKLSPEKMAEIVMMWHERNAWATRFGEGLHEAYCAAIAGEFKTVGRIRFQAVDYGGRLGRTVQMILPDGRPLMYPNATPFRYQRTTLGKEDAEDTYVWPGLLANNATQGTCASLLRDVLRSLDAIALPHGAQLIGDTHDETLVEIPSRVPAHVEEVAEVVGREMIRARPWLAGLPLNCEWNAGPRYGHPTMGGVY